jgi:hypothetical protein
VVEKSVILQIVPRLPGENDGVGDYARTLAQRLSELGQIETLFAAADSALAQKNFAHVILHYVNYGYQKRGVPFALLSILREIRARCRGRFLTIFHEFYASGPPWKSAFWLRPWQRQIAKSIAQMSDAAIVSSETMLQELRQLAPAIRASVHPVFSNFGEPTLSVDQLANRDPHRWVICGGTALVERSLLSFRTIVHRVPEEIAVRELFVIGGNENPAARASVAAVYDRRRRSQSAATTNIRVKYRPEIDAAEASQILTSCSFAWLDYFHRPDVPTDIILKSSVFAGLCAHGVIPVFPHPSSPIEIEDDLLPGPFFIDPNTNNLPAAETTAKLRTDSYHWYHRHAATEHLVREVAITLGFEPSKSNS